MIAAASPSSGFSMISADGASGTWFTAPDVASVVVFVVVVVVVVVVSAVEVMRTVNRTSIKTSYSEGIDGPSSAAGIIFVVVIVASPIDMMQLREGINGLASVAGVGVAVVLPLPRH